MKAIIMAGGFGTRLRPLTINVPKPMVPIGTIPMMEHVVNLLKKNGFTELVSLLFFQAEEIKNHFNDGRKFGVKMDYLQPNEDYGTAGAVRYADTFIDETVLVISGDVLTDFDLEGTIRWHQEKNSEATILLTRVENPLPYGIVIVNEEGKIVRFLEKPSWGEAFSDTINTGIYILEPHTVRLIPPKTNFDFSQNLFPLMLSKQMGLFGMITDGYWKDVGNINEYRRAHEDLLSGQINLELGMRRQNHGEAMLHLGRNVHLGENLKLGGVIVCGDNAVIADGAKIENSVIGARTRVGEGADISRSVIWSDVQIGAESQLTSAIVCDRVAIGENVALLDDVVVSDDSTVGNGATVKANCKIWPGKTVDEGAIVSFSLVWGEKWNRELFTQSKVTGLALTEITAEMAVKLGGAFGAYLGQGKRVVTSRDASDTSRLLKRGLIAGFLAAGVNADDLGMLPIPVVRYALSKGDYAAGVYVRHNPTDQNLIDFIFFNGDGLDMPSANLKKVERLFFGEDYRRARLDEIGHLDNPQGMLEQYRADFIAAINPSAIRKAGFKVVIDYANGGASVVFPTIFSQLGINLVDLNAFLNPRSISRHPDELVQAIVQLSSIVRTLHSDIGFLINPAAEKLTVVDENGFFIDNQLLLLLVTDLFLRTHTAHRIAVPVAASMGVEEIASRYGIEVIRVRNSHLAMMEALKQNNVDFVGGTLGGFIFPGFQMGSDAILNAVYILEMMAKEKVRLGELRGHYEKYIRKSVSVPCPWAQKGKVMRRLITETETKNRQLIDGVRIIENGGWVLVAPDNLAAAFTVLAESESKEFVEETIGHYRTLVENAQE
ncbi:MAG: nucleotidyltransferase [candidate division Zixibacteria bacterium HGW-Zixibacteria-1]|nr:MAG: nucleotidyltransferase [candidate division Zixibacteria bacterium HGW-Zixibacteria-1]